MDEQNVKNVLGDGHAGEAPPPPGAGAAEHGANAARRARFRQTSIWTIVSPLHVVAESADHHTQRRSRRSAASEPALQNDPQTPQPADPERDVAKTASLPIEPGTAPVVSAQSVGGDGLATTPAPKQPSLAVNFVQALSIWPPRPRDPVAIVSMLTVIGLAAWHTALPVYRYQEHASSSDGNSFTFRYMRTEVTVLRGDLFCPRGTEALGVKNAEPCTPTGAAPWPDRFHGAVPYSLLVSVPARTSKLVLDTVGYGLLSASPRPVNCAGPATSTAWDCVIQQPAVLGRAQRLEVPPTGRGAQLAASAALRDIYALPMYEPDDMAPGAPNETDRPSVEAVAKLQERVSSGIVDALDQAANRGQTGLAMPLMGTGKHLKLEPFSSIDASIDAIVRHAERKGLPTLDHIVIVAYHASADKASKAIERVQQRAARLRADNERSEYLPERKLAWLALFMTVIGIVIVPLFVRIGWPDVAARALPGDRWSSLVAYLLLYGNVLNVINDLLDNLFVATFWAKAVVLTLVALSPIALHAVLRHMPTVEPSKAQGDTK